MAGLFRVGDIAFLSGRLIGEEKVTNTPDHNASTCKISLKYDCTLNGTFIL